MHLTHGGEGAVLKLPTNRRGGRQQHPCPHSLIPSPPWHRKRRRGGEPAPTKSIGPANHKIPFLTSMLCSRRTTERETGSSIHWLDINMGTITLGDMVQIVHKYALALGYDSPYLFTSFSWFYKLGWTLHITSKISKCPT